MATVPHPIEPRSQFPTASQSEAMPAADAQFLTALGKRVRELREQRGMTRKALAREADVSERYLGQLESGEGNISILLLRHIAIAFALPPSALLPVEQDNTIAFHRIALIGLRGAGKTSIGTRIAQDLQLPFIELDQEIEQETGLPLSEFFTLYGQAGYRRIERRCLDRVLTQYKSAVLAIGGGVVSEEDTFQLLRARCQTVWLKASPEEHMSRVIAQGDLRPMAGNSEAMEDLKRILTAREPLYEQVDVVVDTSGRTLEQSFQALRQVLKGVSTKTRETKTWELK